MRRLRITGVSERSEAIGSEIRTSTPVSPHPQDSQAYLQYQRGLVNLHRMTGVPPSIKILNGEVRRTSDNAVIGGVYSDIWQGTWLEEEKVALKALRCTRASDPRAKRVIFIFLIYRRVFDDIILAVRKRGQNLVKTQTQQRTCSLWDCHGHWPTYTHGEISSKD